MKTNAENFIDLVGKLYNLPEKQIQQMQNNIPEIDNDLGKYYWDDIERKVQLFYARKNDKSRPRICQILALLESDPNVRKFVPEPEYDEIKPYKRPTTNLWSIQKTFDKLIQVLIDGGVLPDDDGTYHNTRSLIDPKTDLPILNPMQWLGWQLRDAETTRPEVFNIPNANILERIAIAVQNNLIAFKVRDWAKLAERKGGNQ